MRSRPFRSSRAVAITAAAAAIMVVVAAVYWIAQPRGGRDLDPSPSVEDPTESPAPTVTESTSPPSPSAETSVFVGYGSASQGGAGGEVITVTTLDNDGPGSFRDALQANGPRIVRFDVCGEIELDEVIIVRTPFLTIEGQSAPCPVVITGESLRITGNDIIIQHLRFRPGDASADQPADLDGLTVNGGSRIVIDHVEAIWGPDVGGITILNDATDVTVQHSIIGVGLLRSQHPEAFDDDDGHNYGMNIVGLSEDQFARRVTIYRNLITTSQARMPQIHATVAIDVVNNVIYNFDASPTGNPQSLSFVNNLLRSGPAADAAGLGPPEMFIWRPSPSDTFPDLFGDAVYVEGNVTDGFEGVLGEPSRVYRNSPARPLSVEPEPVEGLLERVLAEVGPRPLDAVSQRWLDELETRTGVFFNGAGQDEPTPYGDWITQ